MREYRAVKVEEIRALDREEALRRLVEARQELFNLNFRLATRQLQNHRQVRETKKKIARMATIVREKELGMSQV